MIDVRLHLGGQHRLKINQKWHQLLDQHLDAIFGGFVTGLGFVSEACLIKQIIQDEKGDVQENLYHLKGKPVFVQGLEHAFGKHNR